MVERALDDPGNARASLRICGSTVGRQQLLVAIALKCERIVCLAPSLSPELVELQHLAEAAGARFHVIANHRALAGLVTATDEVFAFADGLLMTREFAAPLLEQAQGVLVQPIEQGLAGGFERIDLNTAAAGAMRVPGRLVTQLNDLPADCDAFSTLQRIALQAGIGQRMLPAEGADGGFWILVASDALAHEIEPRWIRNRIGDQEVIATPGRWIAARAVHLFGAAILDARSGRAAILGGAAATGSLALFAGWYGLTALGIALAGLAWIGMILHALLTRIASDSEPHRVAAPVVDVVKSWLIDALFVMLAGWGAGLQHAQPAYVRYFPPLMLLLVLRLVAAVSQQRPAAWLSDRLVLAAILVVAVATGFIAEVLQLGAVLIAGLGLLASRGFKRIT